MDKPVVPMPDAVVKRLHAFLARATPLPWMVHGPGEDGSIYIDADLEGERPVAMMMSGSPHSQDIKDADLTVAAVNALPSLLQTAERVKALEEENAGLREALERIRKPGAGAGMDWSDRECADYWLRQCTHQRAIARAALAPASGDGEAG